MSPVSYQVKDLMMPAARNKDHFSSFLDDLKSLLHLVDSGILHLIMQIRRGQVKCQLAVPVLKEIFLALRGLKDVPSLMINGAITRNTTFVPLYRVPQILYATTVIVHGKFVKSTAIRAMSEQMLLHVLHEPRRISNYWSATYICIFPTLFNYH